MDYTPELTATINRKGVLDIDTVKGCEFGMSKYPDGGCYGHCYAFKIARVYGFNFSKSVSRKKRSKDVENMVRKHRLSWFRIGTMGDPCYDWENTLNVCEWLNKVQPYWWNKPKVPIIITKHWIVLSDKELSRLDKCGVIVNTSISSLDSDYEIEHRLKQFNRLIRKGIKSILRIVSVKFGQTINGDRLSVIQDELFKNTPTIDNPLRIPASDKRVKNGDILVEKHEDLGGGNFVSIVHNDAYLGKCNECPDQCGVNL